MNFIYFWGVQKAIYFISDAHLGAPNREQIEQPERKLVAWLLEIAPTARAVYIVGDLFDFWFEYKQVVPKGYTRLLGALASLADAGVEIHLFRGNHDLWYGDYFANEWGAHIHQNPITVEAFGQKALVGHGDGLGPGDIGYKGLKRVFTFPPFVWAFRWLHPDLGIALAGVLSRGSRARTGHKDSQFTGIESEALWIHCCALQKENPVDLYIFGHRHLPLDLAVPGRDAEGQQARYINLGDWLQYFTYGEWSESGFEMKYLGLP